MDDRDLVSLEDKADPPAPRNRGASPLQHFIGSVVGNGVICGFLMFLGQQAWSWIGSSFATVLPFLLLERAADLVSRIPPLFGDSHLSTHIGKLIRRSGSALASFMLWQHYPFIFAALGIGQLDGILPMVFMVLTFLHGIGVLTAVGGLLKGPKALPPGKADPKDLEDDSETSQASRRDPMETEEQDRP